MTLPSTLGQEKRKSRTLPLGSLFLGFSGLFLFLLMLKNAEIANEYMREGLQLCARVIVPSLFPFLILSELLVSTSFTEGMIRRLSRPIGRLFGLSPSGCCAVLLGILCGFPVGAKCISSAYDQGKLTREEAERALCFSNTPSPAFLVGVVGVSLWSDRRIGWTLYMIAITVNLASGILLNQRRKKNSAVNSIPEYAPTSGQERRVTGVTLLTRSMGSATGSMLLICGYVVFFTVLGGTIGKIASSLFHFSLEWHALLQSILELSGGVSRCALIENRMLAAVLTAFAVGWSGFSVHCQVLSMCEGRGFSSRTYFLSKLLQGMMCALVFGLVLTLFPLL